MTLHRIQSKDGTTIAYEKTGTGPALVLVGGAFCDRTAPTSGTPLGELLAHRFSVFSYDRRGRGESSDARAAPIDRELEDLEAVLDVAKAPAFVFGNSSGALLAVDAAARGLRISKLALYEPPVILDGDRASSFAALANELDDAVKENRRSDAVELYFTRVMQMPAPAAANIKRSPDWPSLEAISHTLSMDLRITAVGPKRLATLQTVRAITMVMNGTASPPWMRDAIKTFSSQIPGARHQTLEGQSHAVDVPTLAKALEIFFAG